ncbi:MAG: nucleotidyl transferase AbiEii/AbiGii toxin family protein [Gammaproteobacteria bacterium]|nr:nucleotidyl transferase AbiEii/AbiGii toxin family protein [Gammaproteobacteria bacterium]
MTTFDLGMLPGPQRRLWSALGDTPTDFVLYGGTALALRLGHRESVDFDFFSREPFAPEDLRKRIGYLEAARTLQQSGNTLTCVVDREGDVHVSFFGGLDLCSVREPDRADGPGIFVASLLDVAATKVTTVQARADAKDYLDIDAVLRAGVALEDALGAAGAVYGTGFNPLLTLKALTYYAEGDLDTVPNTVRDRLAAAVGAVDLKRLPTFEPRPWLRRP